MQSQISLLSGRGRLQSESGKEGSRAQSDVIVALKTEEGAMNLEEGMASLSRRRQGIPREPLERMQPH